MPDHYQLDSYDYDLPRECIAQFPCRRREEARLFVLDLPGETERHLRFGQLDSLLRAGDLLVVNDSRVFPARLLGKKSTGGNVEILLLHFPQENDSPSHGSSRRQASALALLRSSRRPAPGSRLDFGRELKATVEGYEQDGKARILLEYTIQETGGLEEILERYGRVPLPPYIQRPKGGSREDRQRYQTRYAVRTGSVAAPTAGLHFSDSLLEKIRQSGVRTAAVTLHVGYGTFAPVRCRDIRDHRIHEEYVSVSPDTAALVNRTRAEGGRIWAVGTTTARTLEFAADSRGGVRSLAGPCDLYIYPGYDFRIIDNLITNFHLPRSSLLFLVAALAGRERILAAYQEAVNRGYRFFSYGDAMAIITSP